MNDTAPRDDMPRPIVTDLVDVGHLGLFLLSDPDSAPELHVLDGQNSIRIGSHSTARALAAALNGFAHEPSPAALIERVEHHKDRLAAQEHACGVAGCDGTLHDAIAPPNEWDHRVRSAEHLGMTVDIVVSPANDDVFADVFLKLEDNYDAEGLRSLATRLQLQAASLLEYADVLDRRARRVHRRSNATDELRDLEG